MISGITRHLSNFIVRLLQIKIILDWMIGWGLTLFSTIYQWPVTYSCVSCLSHTSTPHNSLSKQLAAFPYRLSCWTKVNDAFHSGLSLLSNVGKNVGKSGVQTHNHWIDSPHCYRLSYRGSGSKMGAILIWCFNPFPHTTILQQTTLNIFC